MRAFRLSLLLALPAVLSSCDVTSEAEGRAGAQRQALGAPALIGDLEPSVGSATGASSSPFAFTPLSDGGTVFFATTATEGTEVFRTDGTAGGTWMVRDTNPGVGSVSTPLTYFTPFNDALFFRGGVQSGRLYRTDGTAAGTGPVADVCVGCEDLNLDSSGSLPLGPGRIAGGLAWIGSTSTGGHAVYASDGTAAGTHLVATVVTLPSVFASTGSRIFFDNGSSFSSPGTELWSSDGTAAGTGMVIDLQPGAGSSNPTLLTPVGNTLYFIARASPTATELWRTDGTLANTARVASLGDVVVNAFTVSGPKAYLEWHLNGNGATTLELIDLTTGARTPVAAASTLRAPVAIAPDRLAYVGPLGDLMATNGTDAGTVGLGQTSVFLSSLESADGFAWYGVSANVFRSDGTLGGTSAVATLAGGRGASNFGHCGPGRVCFAGNASTGNEPWVFDGVGASPLGDLAPARGVSSSPFTNRVLAGAQLFFSATTKAQGEELWRTDGVSASLVKDLVAGTGSGSPQNLVEAQGKAYFLSGGDVWRSDGTPGGTEKLTLPQAGTVRELVGTPLGAYATVTLGNNTYAIDAWTSPSASATTIATFPTVVVPARPPGLFTAIGDTVFFYGWTPGTFGQVWRTDGTPSNTAPVTALTASAGNQLFNFTNFQNRLHFSGNAGSIYRLECSGSPTQVGSQGRYFTPSGDSLFMEASADGLDFSLYRLQGNTQTRVVELNTSGTDAISELQPWNGGVIFSATNGVDRKLYVSDGTAGGTRPLTALTLAQPTTGAIAVQGGSVYVTALVPDAGFELVELHLDGGFTLVGDLAPGLANSNPTPVAAVGSRFVFSADVAAYGREPWGVDIDRAPFDAGVALPPCTWAVLDGGMIVDAGSSDAGGPDAGTFDAGGVDGGGVDAGGVDAGGVDAGTDDAGPPDAGDLDAGPTDAGAFDAGDLDAGNPDAGGTSEVDAGREDAGALDAGSQDAGPSGDAGQHDTSPAVGCACTAGNGQLGLFILAIALLRRRR